jgi:hypothetical protein
MPCNGFDALTFISNAFSAETGGKPFWDCPINKHADDDIFRNIEGKGFADKP